MLAICGHELQKNNEIEMEKESKKIIEEDSISKNGVFCRYSRTIDPEAIIRDSNQESYGVNGAARQNVFASGQTICEASHTVLHSTIHGSFPSRMQKRFSMQIHRKRRGIEPTG